MTKPLNGAFSEGSKVLKPENMFRAVRWIIFCLANTLRLMSYIAPETEAVLRPAIFKFTTDYDFHQAAGSAPLTMNRAVVIG